MLILFPGESGLKETLRFVEEKVGIGLWTWDFQSDEMQWSPGVYRLFGVEPNTPTPAFHATRAMVHPDDQKIAAKLERLLREGVPATSEFRIVRRNGRISGLSSREQEPIRDQ